MDKAGSVGLDLSFVPHLFLMEPFLDGALEEQVLCYWLSSDVHMVVAAEYPASVLPQAFFPSCLAGGEGIYPAAGGGARSPHGCKRDCAG